IAQDMWAQMQVEREKSRSMPSFENLHNEVQLYYKFQRAYAFIFLDTHVLNHPVIREGFRKMTVQAIRDNEATIAFALRSDNLIPEPLPGIYHNLAFTTWMLAFFWLAQQIIRGEKTGQDGEKMIWSLLAPYFTEKGKAAFIKFFGLNYYENLGPAFDPSAFMEP
ncbi:MAG: TetR/AcrR family transcriptional regulator, partial [Bacteroidota bacterium]